MTTVAYRLFETSTIMRSTTPFTGVETTPFFISTGSRLVFTLYVLAIDPGATIEAKIKNRFSTDVPLEDRLTLSASAVGPKSDVLTDFHSMFEAEITVTGGNAEYALGVTVNDNALGGGLHPLEVNVVEADTDPPQEIFNQFEIAPALAPGSEQPITSYTVPADIEAWLERIEFSGDEQGKFRAYINAEQIAQRRTGTSKSGQFEFTGISKEGITLEPGDVISLTVEHSGGGAAAFEGRIQLLSLGELTADEFILLESGSRMLQEDGSRLIW